jgi:hypothetical protein
MVNITYAGYIDSFSDQAIGGWAVGNKVGTSVEVFLNGQSLGVISPSIVRGDLLPLKLAPLAGFEYRFEKPLAEGDVVEVRYPNGIAISGIHQKS